MRHAGQGAGAAARVLKDGTLTDTYAKIADFICGNSYVDLATSNVVNILASPQNISDAQQFVEAMQWLSHPVNGDFYNALMDPDFEADRMLARLKYYGERLGISVDYDPIENMVQLGVASPIVLDLGGDGVETTSYLARNVTFDLDGDGVVDQTAWISPNDGFLAIDLNGNGVVDGGGELFGGLERGDGFSKLATYDSDGDGAITIDDDGYENLRVWRDVNSDGVSVSSEMSLLSDLEINSIDLAYESMSVYQNFNLMGVVDCRSCWVRY